MQRKNKFIILLMSALLTFGVLKLTIGKPPYLKHFEKEHCEKHQSFVNPNP